MTRLWLLFALLSVACAPGARESAGVVAWSSASASAAVDRDDVRMARVLSRLADPVQVRGAPVTYRTVAERMALFGVPGVSVAVADGGRIVWAQGFGVRDADTHLAVTPHTLFQAASISKAIAATGTLRLAQQGAVNLDVDVNRYLSSWHVPETELTRQQKVTLRRLMSHRAGATVHGFIGYRAGSVLPTITQLLDGVAPANNEPVRIDLLPGSQTRYSGGGVAIEMLVTMDVTAVGYEAAMRQLVLAPFGMLDSTFAQPPSRLADTASAHDSAGQVYAGNPLMYAALAAGGLWSTPSDLLRWAVQVAEAEAGRATELLSPALAASMTHRLARDEPVALGTFVWGEGEARYYWHGGKNEGYTCELLYFPESGKGAAVMTNGDGGGALLGSLLLAIAEEYGWAGYAPRVVEAVDAVAMSSRLVGSYFTSRPTAIDLEVTRTDSGLWLESRKFGIRSAAVLTGPRELTILNQASFSLSFELDGEGNVSRFLIGDIELRRRP